MVNFVLFALIVSLFYLTAYGLSALLGRDFNSVLIYLLVGWVVSEFVDRMMGG